MNTIAVTPLRRISTPKGDVLHGLKDSDPGFAGFGEVYLSIVLKDSIKGWKRHRRMTLNLICVQGAVRIVGYAELGTPCLLDEIVSPDQAARYSRVTVPPGFWIGFQGISSGINTLMNVASMPHDPTEADVLPLDAFQWPGAST